MGEENRKQELIIRIKELTESGRLQWLRLRRFCLSNPDNIFLKEWMLSKNREYSNFAEAKLNDGMSFCAQFEVGTIILAVYKNEDGSESYAIELQSTEDSQVFEIIHTREFQAELMLVAIQIERSIGNPDDLLESILATRG